MSDFIAVDTIRSYDSEEVTESIKAGEPVVRQSGDGGARLLDPASDEDVDWLAGYERTGDHLERYPTDYTSYEDLYTYKPASAKDADVNEDWDDRAPLIPLADKDVVRCLTPTDSSLTEPTFEENDTVGFIAAPNGPRLVPEGYTDDFSGTSTTYEEANDNFVTLGKVDIQAPFKTIRSGYGEYIPVRVTDEL